MSHDETAEIQRTLGRLEEKVDRILDIEERMRSVETWKTRITAIVYGGATAIVGLFWLLKETLILLRN